MALSGGEDVYATLLLSDTYLPGALVLAHSLRDAGTSKPLAVLVTLDTISAVAIDQLKTVYDYVIPVPRIKNEASVQNLDLMNRPDLHSAFTKINLWKLAQFRKVVYIDADVVAYRAPDELFELPAAFAAAADIGWPDLFNTGVMVLTPNVDKYHALLAMAQQGTSFDGADQGLLNMHFENDYHRLPFTYNVTPSAHYQYLPAYRHFRDSIHMVHFIGPDKPWKQGRSASTSNGSSSSPYAEMVGKWWAVYDRHYRQASPAGPGEPQPPSPPEIVQYFVKGEFQPRRSHTLTAGEPSFYLGASSYGQHSETLPPPPEPQPFAAIHYRRLQEYPSHNTSHDSSQVSSQESSQVLGGPSHPQGGNSQSGYEPAPPNQPVPRSPNAHSSFPSPPPPPPPPLALPASTFSTFPAPLASAAFSATPVSSAPLALSSPNAQTEDQQDQVRGHQPGTPHPPAANPPSEQPHRPLMEPSWDAQWQPPPVNAKPEAMNFPTTHYEMSQDTTPFMPPQRYPSPPRDMWYEVPKEAPAPAHEKPTPIFPWEIHQPTPTRVFSDPSPPTPPLPSPPHGAQSGQPGTHSRLPSHSSGTEPSMTLGSPSVDMGTEPTTPTTPTATRQFPPSDPWASFTRTNAWDDIPQIDRYVDGFQRQHQRPRGRARPPGPLKLGGLSGNFSQTASATGGYQASAWPSQRRSSKVTDFPTEEERPSLPVTPAPIRRPKFWGGGGAVGAGGDGSDGGNGGGGMGGDAHLLPAAHGVPVQSDWDPVAQLQMLAKQQSELLLQKLGQTERDMAGARHGPPKLVSPRPVKPGGLETSSVRSIDVGNNSEFVFPVRSRSVAKASYLGPGIAFEKDEDLMEHGMTAALPSEEEMDVLET